DFDLDLMKPNQTLFSLTAHIIEGLKDVLSSFTADYVFVHGDTTTTMASSIAAFYAQTKVCHVEAGLRTYNKYSPFPEEINRQITTRLADYHFAPTEASKQNLVGEGISEANILVTGNTVIDALFDGIDRIKEIQDEEIDYLSKTLDLSKTLILVTGHRRENHGQGFINLCDALKRLAEDKQVLIVYPVHLNPNVHKVVYKMLANVDNIKLVDPLGYPAFIWLMNASKVIITDSGGVQEEAPSLGKPVIVTRDNTERPEAVYAGTVKLVGTDAEKIHQEAKKLLDDESYYQTKSR